MPKEKRRHPVVYKVMLLNLERKYFQQIDNKIVFCKVCNTKVSSEKRFSITQHIAAEKHRKSVKRAEEKKDKSQQLLFRNSSKKLSFKTDLCKAMLSANIPTYLSKN